MSVTYFAQNGLIRINAKSDSISDFIEDLEIDGINFGDFITSTGGDAYHIMIKQVKKVKFKNCTFKLPSKGGVHVTGDQCEGATESGKGSDYSYKLLYQTRKVTIEDYFFDGEGVQTPHAEQKRRVGIQVEGGALNTLINNCTFKDCVKSSVREIGGFGTKIINPSL